MRARPGRVDFEDGRIRLSVSGNGVGLPACHAERSRGFNGMRADSERMGGTFVVEGDQEGGGTTIAMRGSL